MNPENENIDLFENYLKENLSTEELSVFEERLNGDANFKIEFEQYQSVRSGLKKHFRAEMKSKLSEIDERLDDSKMKGKVLSIKWWLISGAAAIIIFGLFVFNNHNTNSLDLVAQYWPYEAGLPVKMSEKRKYDEAMNAFKLEEWDKAEKLLKPIESDTAHYYLGVVNYERKDYSSSLEYFNEIDTNSSFYEEAQFRLALISILKEDLTSAKVILKNQVEVKSAFSDEANLILEALK
ncbi:tetratricopeptide repeat protein [Brumimicrobium glaciale]|uniref:Tetratricopeptide repeat protein n=1 Tax=Brumimicrobium glaciale TaxID=200475 RepID=A0A4Q4KI18_9FLAO|nr:tetratricopeptide repeat protein [Brumimicrobium glaciale]RYM32852.1 tetratricopeptide repeat protein [Brumimicrobium glaciale]